MTAVTAITRDEKYFFFLPIVQWAWNKLGINFICFTPADAFKDELGNCVSKWLRERWNPHCTNKYRMFKSDPDREATYAQNSRLYAAAMSDIHRDEWLITTDADMLVFRSDIFHHKPEGIHVLGSDLTPPDQVPICYTFGPTWVWAQVMGILQTDSPQTCLDFDLKPLESIHFRSDHWSHDQWLLKQKIVERPAEVNLYEHLRAKPGTQFATNRVDRDDDYWREKLGPTLIDAHLWRPGYEPRNFAKIVSLLKAQYPADNFDWVLDYRNEYCKYL